MNTIRGINYITYDSWWDTDKTILPDLCKDYQVNVFVLNPQQHQKKYLQKQQYGSRHFTEMEQSYRDRNPLSLFIALNFFLKVVKAFRSDYANVIVVGKNPFFLMLFLLFASKKRTIVCLHNFVEHSGKRHNLNDWMKRRFYHRFRHFLFYSKSQKKLFERNYPSKNAYCLNIPLKDFGMPRKRIVDDEKTVFLFFGLISDYKRLDLFIKAANQVATANSLFIIAGNCQNWKKYEGMIQKPECFRCDIRFIENEEVADYFCSADFLVLPYDDATQSGPMMIALNYGVPIIASDIEAFQGIIIHGINGFLFNKGNLQSLVNVLNHVATLNRDQMEQLRKEQLQTREQYKKECDVLKTFSTIIVRI